MNDQLTKDSLFPSEGRQCGTCDGQGWNMTEAGPGTCVPCDGTGRKQIACKGCGHRPARGFYLLHSGYCLVCEVL